MIQGYFSSVARKNKLHFRQRPISVKEQAEAANTSSGMDPQ
jgi:hypothetical protein